MKVYQDLELPLEGTSTKNIISKIEDILPDTWVRDTKREDELNIKSGDEKQYAYSTIKNPGLPNARLWLADIGRGKLYVSNIVPNEAGKLTMDEYNSILMSFVDILKKDFSIKYELSKSDKALEDIIPEHVVQKLKIFSNNANKSTSYSHPCDFERWLDFVVSFHQCRCEKRLGLIERWLHEEAGWSWETASELSSQLEYSLDILSYYDRKK